MLQENEIVIYGAEGVCKVTGKTQRDIAGETVDYWVLKPVYSEQSTFYVPENLAHKVVHPILSRQEVLDTIDKMPQMPELWVDSDIERKELYRNILKSGDRQGLVRIIKTLWLRRQVKRKLHINDEFYLKECEKLLYAEFAYALGIERDEVLPLIQKTLGDAHC